MVQKHKKQDKLYRAAVTSGTGAAPAAKAPGTAGQTATKKLTGQRRTAFSPLPTLSGGSTRAFAGTPGTASRRYTTAVQPRGGTGNGAAVSAGTGLAVQRRTGSARPTAWAEGTAASGGTSPVQSGANMARNTTGAVASPETRPALPGTDIGQLTEGRAETAPQGFAQPQPSPAEPLSVPQAASGGDTGETQTQAPDTGTSEADADTLLRQLLEREEFTYDPGADPLYEQYRNGYIQAGHLAMEDAMGRAAALTGGYGNSYAQTVGQQVYGSYLQQMEDVIPELYQLAWNKYQAEGDSLQERYSLARAQQQEAYELALSMLQAGMVPSQEVLEASGMELGDAVTIFEQENPGAFADTGADMVYYTDGSGVSHIGYVIDGVTYTDPYGTNPIPEDSTVTLSDGSRWYKDAGGSVQLPTFGPSMEEGAFQSLLEQLSIAAGYEEINALLSEWSGQMSEAQWQQVETWLRENGV